MIAWGETCKGWLLAVKTEEGAPVGRLCLRPLSREDRRLLLELADGVSLPDRYPVYVVAQLAVPEKHRRRGHARSLLLEGMRHLIELHPPVVWLGLMTDTLRRPVGRTRPDIRAVWGSVIGDYGLFFSQNGFLKVTRYAVETLT